MIRLVQNVSNYFLVCITESNMKKVLTVNQNTLVKFVPKASKSKNLFKGTLMIFIHSQIWEKNAKFVVKFCQLQLF